MGILGEIPSVTYHLGGPPKWEAKQVLHHSPLRSWTEAFSLETIQEKDSQMKTWKLFERKWVFKGSLYDTSKQGSIFRRKSLQITMHLPDLWFCLDDPPYFSQPLAWLLFPLDFPFLFASAGVIFSVFVPTHQAPLCAGVKELMCLGADVSQQPRTSKLGTVKPPVEVRLQPNTLPKPKTWQDVFSKQLIWTNPSVLQMPC